MNTVAVYIEHFVKSGWNGYSPELQEKWGFDMALEWYIHSNMGAPLETKFLNAATCLEMLMDKAYSQNEGDKLLDDESFKAFYRNMKDHAKGVLTMMQVEKPVRASVFRSMKGMQRRSFVDKFGMLLNDWGISYNDTGVTLEEIKDVRNNITHQGKYAEVNTESLNYLFRVYNGLFNILTRIFLAMLNYEGDYFDAPNSRWVKFEDVYKRNNVTNMLS